MTSSDETHGRDSRSFRTYLALIICGLLIAVFMPLSVGRIEVAEKTEPQVQQTEPRRVVELLPDPPGPDISVAEPATSKLPVPMPRPAAKDDATGQTARLFDRLRAIEARERARKPGVNPLRDPNSQPKRNPDRPGPAQLLFDELP